MATIDLGKIKQVWRGTYNNSTAYVVDDLVEYTDSGITSTYICVANSQGNAPSSSGTAHASWNYVAKGVADPIPTQSGNSGKVLTTNGSAVSWGTGFAGTHYLAYNNYHQHGTGVNVNGYNLPNGTSDGQRDCILINDGNYHTVTPAHNDDLFIIKGASSVYINMNNNNGTYGGLGIQSSTATNFSANRNIPFSTGQHSWGNGASGQGDHYEMWQIDQMLTAGQMALTPGTTYYIRIIAQVHSPNNTIYYNNNSGSPNPRSRFYSSLRHYKKVT